MFAGLSAAIKQGGTTGLILLCRHITGQWDSIDAEQQVINEAVLNGGLEQEIVSYHTLADGTEIVIVTSYPHIPSLRWTEICLPEEAVFESDNLSENGPLTEDSDVEL